MHIQIEPADYFAIVINVEGFYGGVPRDDSLFLLKGKMKEFRGGVENSLPNLLIWQIRTD